MGCGHIINPSGRLLEQQSHSGSSVVCDFLSLRRGSLNAAFAFLEQMFERKKNPLYQSNINGSAEVFFFFFQFYLFDFSTNKCQVACWHELTH